MPKHKYIESPERMWELFKEYERETKSTPFLVHDFVGKDAHDVRRERERCLTMEGFEEYVAERDIIQSLDQYFSNQEGLYDEYMGICSRIRRKIRRDQIEGGMAGIYNASITQRLNGLVDKQEHNVLTEQPLFDDDEG